jgi:hypothetical protein
LEQKTRKRNRKQLNRDIDKKSGNEFIDLTESEEEWLSGEIKRGQKRNLEKEVEELQGKDEGDEKSRKIKQLKDIKLEDILFTEEEKYSVNREKTLTNFHLKDSAESREKERDLVSFGSLNLNLDIDKLRKESENHSTASKIVKGVLTIIGSEKGLEITSEFIQEKSLVEDLSLENSNTWKVWYLILFGIIGLLLIINLIWIINTSRKNWIKKNLRKLFEEKKVDRRVGNNIEEIKEDQKIVQVGKENMSKDERGLKLITIYSVLGMISQFIKRPINNLTEKKEDRKKNCIKRKGIELNSSGKRRQELLFEGYGQLNIDTKEREVRILEELQAEDKTFIRIVQSDNEINCSIKTLLIKDNFNLILVNRGNLVDKDQLEEKEKYFTKDYWKKSINYFDKNSEFMEKDNNYSDFNIIRILKDINLFTSFRIDYSYEKRRILNFNWWAEVWPKMIILKIIFDFKHQIVNNNTHRKILSFNNYSNLSNYIFIYLIASKLIIQGNFIKDSIFKTRSPTSLSTSEINIGQLFY